MVSEKRKIVSKKETISNKKNKIEKKDDSIMSLGMDDEEYNYDDEKAISYNDNYYNGNNNNDDDDNNNEGSEDDDNNDFLEGGSEESEGEEQLDDSEAAVGRATILPEKSELEAKEFVNLKVKNVSYLKQSVAPTNEEIQHLKETSDLYNSNLFRLQIVELFKEIKIDYSKLTSLESALHQLKSTIEKIPSDQQVTITEANIDKIKLFDFNGGEGLSIQYSKPSQIDVVGSFMTRSVLKSNENVDLMVEIPKSVFESKDANDFKYFNKRNLYMLKIFNSISKVQRFSDIQFKDFNGDSNKQIIVISPKEDPKTGARTKFQIRIIPTIPNDLFNIYTKFHPNMSCLFFERDNFKIETFKEEDSKDNNNNSNNSNNTDSSKNKKKSFDEVKRTPFYNNSILEDIFINDHMQLINEKCENAPVLIDTMLLLKLWLKIKMIPTVNSFQLSMLLIHLYSIGKVNKSMSSYQAFRMVMVYICKDFQKKPIQFMKVSTDHGQSIKQNQYQEEFEKLYPVALIDDSGLLNIWSSISVWGFKQLMIEARLVIENLDSGNGFEEIFMTKFHFYQEYDMIITIKINKQLLNNQQSLKVPTNDYYQQNTYLNYRIYQLIKKSLTKRVTKINILKINQEDINNNNNNNNNNKEEIKILIGLKVNSENWLSVIDLGPPADHVNAPKFREFWGNKSQIRRFKDGSILEAVTWNPKNGSRHLVIEEIIKYTLNFHLQIPVENVTSVVSELDQLVISEQVQDHTLSILSAKQKLISTIQSLGLPLGIEAYPAIDPALRYTSILCTKDDRYLENQPISILLQFEQNQQWTKDVDSINALKQAFLLKIARELQASQFQPRLTDKYVDLCVDGFIFRCMAYYPKEIEFMREQWLLDGLDEQESLQRNSQHHTFIQSLHTTYSSYGPTTRIALRWIHSHLFSDFIDHQTVELLVASLYKVTENDDGSFDTSSIPKTPIMGFLRFLFLLYTFDFNEKPLIVDYLNSIDKNAQHSIQSTFDIQKKSQNPPLLFIATDKDRLSMWFRKSTIKNREQWEKMKLFAQKSIELIESNYTSQSFNWLSVFQPSFIEFDAIFNLDEKLIPNHSREILNITNKNYNLSIPTVTIPVPTTTTTTTTTTPSTINQIQTSKKPVFRNITKKQPLQQQQQQYQQIFNQNSNLNELYNNLQPGFNPVLMLVQELKDRFSDYFTIQYDLVGGNKLAIKWKSDAFLPTPFKPSKSKYSIQITKDSNLIVPNIFEIINEIQMLGGKLIKGFKLNQNSINLVNEFN
ncbi:hypothetical protein ACTA71_007581 [Dictyostelium dimigraforme]